MTVFSPGCALLIYKPHLAENLSKFLYDEFQIPTEQYTKCCKNPHEIPDDTEIVIACTSCENRYLSHNENIRVKFLWELLVDSNFDFPDYNGLEISVQDTCNVRDNPDVYNAVRKILNKMNINIIEAEKSKGLQTCCGGAFYGIKSTEELHDMYRKKAAEMPAENVCVYCFSCMKNMQFGGKKPRYLIDLLYNEETDPGEPNPEIWRAELNEFIAAH